MPTMVGLEAEFRYTEGHSRDDVIAAIRGLGLSCHSGQDSNYSMWSAKNDGSISGGVELASPKLDFDDMRDRKQVSDVIRAIKPLVATDHRAGIHVHVEVAGMSNEQRASLAAFATKYEDFLFRMGSSGWRTMRNGWATYTKPYTASHKTELLASNFGWDYVAGRCCDHYHMVNPATGHTTVEFRIFNSSKNAKRIQGYMALAVAVTKAARFGRISRSFQRFDAYPLGGMQEGWREPSKCLNSALRTIRVGGMALKADDSKLLKELWSDSRPQGYGDNAETRRLFLPPDWDRSTKGSAKKGRVSFAELLANEELDDEHPRPNMSRDSDGYCQACGCYDCTCCSECNDTQESCSCEGGCSPRGLPD